MAYDRLLERLYLVDEGWIIKGATALLARDIGVRGTIDIDLYREVAREIAETDLRRAAARAVRQSPGRSAQCPAAHPCPPATTPRRCFRRRRATPR
jgi:hypothetical protein